MSYFTASLQDFLMDIVCGLWRIRPPLCIKNRVSGNLIVIGRKEKL